MVSATVKCCMLLGVCWTIHACSELNDAPPKPVEFTWEVDSSLLQHGPFLANVLWGTDTNNIYLGVTNTTSYKSLFRWDGKKWSVVRFPVLGLWNEVYDIDGLDSSFFVAVGGTGAKHGQAMAYDHGRWLDLALPMKRDVVTTVDVVSRNEIYVGGVDGILKYDGRSWTWLLDSTESRIDSRGITFWLDDLEKAIDGRLYFTCHNIAARYSTLYFWEYFGSRFVVIDSCEQNAESVRFGPHLTSFQNILLSAGYGVYTRQSGKWNRVHDAVASFMNADRSEIVLGNRDGFFHYSDNIWTDVTPAFLQSFHPGFCPSAVRVQSQIMVVLNRGYENYIIRGRRR